MSWTRSAGAIEAVVVAMRTHAANVVVQRNACTALFNFNTCDDLETREGEARGLSRLW
jgi:hypothetical protein